MQANERRRRGERGYSFVELLVVSVILLVLASAVAPLTQVTIQRQREVELRRALREIRTAIDEYKDAVDLGVIGGANLDSDNQGYPPDLETLVEGVEPRRRRQRGTRQVPEAHSTRSNFEAGRRVGTPLLSGPTRFEPLGRRQRLRRVFEGARYCPGRFSIPRVVTVRAFRSGQGGWTLLELTIVISLITVLATIALVGYRSAVTRSKEAVLKEDLFRMRDAIDQHYADKQEYPETLQALVTEGYLRAVPNEPFTGLADSWQPVLSEIDPADPFAQGVFDVKTTYSGVALDGTAYADW